MANLNSAIPRLDDSTALRVFRELQSKHPPQGMYLDVAGISQINLLTTDPATLEIVSKLDRQNAYLIASIGLIYGNLNIRYHRTTDPNRLSPFYDEIHIDHTGNAGPNESQRLELIELLNSKVRLGDVRRPNDAAAKASTDLESIYHATVLKLETSFAEQIQKITNWTVEQTTALEHEKLKLAEETTAERERLRKEHEAKLEALKQDADALEAKKKDLDDRAYMHARRGIRSDLQRTIKGRQERFTLTPETRRLRTPVHVTMIALLVALGAANYANLLTLLNFDFSNATIPVLIWALGKQSVLTLVFVGALMFYIRWMNRWFEQHASAEFLLKQFELDIDRASWVVETAMEWRRDQQAEIPTPLLEGIARNLFSDRSDSSAAHSAADDLASALVGNASQLKLKMGENELNFDRKGLAGLGKAETVK
jgi:hypothetical protein